MRARLERIVPETIIFSVYAAMTVFMTWPVVTGLNRFIYGIDSDNMGILATWWWSGHASQFGGTRAFNTMIGYPFGQKMITATPEFLYEYCARFLRLFMPDAVAYNLMILSGFFLSGVTMYLLVRYLTKDRPVSFFAGFAYTVSAYHALQAMHYIPLSLTQWMPLYILALVRYTRERSDRNALYLLISAVLVGGHSIHYALFMATFTVTFVAGSAAYGLLTNRKERGAGENHGRRSKKINIRTVIQVSVVFLVFWLVFLPLAGLSMSQDVKDLDMQPAPSSIRDSKRMVASASPHSYLLPLADNFSTGRLTERFANQHVDMWDNSLYLGAVIIVLAGMYLLILLRPIRSMKGSIELPAAEDRRLSWGLVAAALTALLLSFPTEITLAGARIPLPAEIVYRLVPWFRWHSRFGSVVIICATLFASLSLKSMTCRMQRQTKVMVVSGLALLLAVEMLYVPPFRYFELPKEPGGAFSLLEEEDISGGIAIYPFLDPGSYGAQRWLYYQTLFQLPMVNGGQNSSYGEALSRTTYNIFNPDTPMILSRMGITHVLFITDLGLGEVLTDDIPGKVPSTLEHLGYAEADGLCNDGHLFRVNSPKADIVPYYTGEITVPNLDSELVTVRYMNGGGTIMLTNHSGREIAADIMVPLRNFVAGTNAVEISVNGRRYPRESFARGEAREIRLDGISIPKDGAVIDIVVTGANAPLDRQDSYLFGAELASFAIGDIRILEIP